MACQAQPEAWPYGAQVGCHTHPLHTHSVKAAYMLNLSHIFDVSYCMACHTKKRCVKHVPAGVNTEMRQQLHLLPGFRLNPKQ
jgi:hypothetical protein